MLRSLLLNEHIVAKENAIHARPCDGLGTPRRIQMLIFDYICQAYSGSGLVKSIILITQLTSNSRVYPPCPTRCTFAFVIVQRPGRGKKSRTRLADPFTDPSVLRYLVSKPVVLSRKKRRTPRCAREHPLGFGLVRLQMHLQRVPALETSTACRLSAFKLGPDGRRIRRRRRGGFGCWVRCAGFTCKGWRRMVGGWR
jgi:hypothetical protein